MAKIFTYRGKTLEELKKMDTSQFMELVPARIRRSLKRGFTEEQKKVLARIRKQKKNIETQCRDLIILPEMVGITIKVHQGKEYFPLIVTEDMLGHVIGEFALTRRKVAHNAPGVGATRSSSSLSMK